ncbi:carboxymuconolactone decarboxylase family protein [Chitinasiproducens palmae]|uniref:Alkylhydroperoxidase AhpD family core domain-containing protein n=1 Tax=Chitinasiproducens palmae TaxID=1770053 RepID=A0A1H2PPS0_9BURK|nr:carboxymuconolactone decarboxylase family protein [Chitinasiproducens palmae]SDV48792.1 alkylhydroperoxidase AhpD family core domain-containing protein [Chitinasiproducens palmae]
MSHPRNHDQEARIVGALERQHPDPKAFRTLSAPVWRSGALSEKDKHLIAVAIAQITRCAFCIEHHAALARKTGATRDEALAFSYLSAVLEALGSSDVSIEAGQLVTVDEAAVAGKPIADARLAFARQVFGNDLLEPGLRWLAAAAIAYAQSNEANRQLFHRQALANGQPEAALDEAYALVVVLRAGAVYAHTLHVVDAFEDAPDA